jgi:hypothetical protein
MCSFDFRHIHCRIERRYEQMKQRGNRNRARGEKERQTKEKGKNNN